MARVFYGAIVRRLSGALGSDVFANCGRVEYVRKKCENPTPSNTPRQELIRNSWRTLSRRWAVLDNPVRMLWNQYASNMPEYSSGLNAYLHLNQRLLSADREELVYNDLPPFETTTVPNNPTWELLVKELQINMTWVPLPYPVTLFLQWYYKIHKPNTMGRRSFWTQFITYPYLDPNIMWDHNFDPNNKIHNRIRLIDLAGRVSPWSSQKIIVTV